MKEIKPTKKQVFEELRNGCGCCWLGGSGCECKSRQLKVCYEECERRLTRTEYTEEEIKNMRAINEKAMAEIDRILNEFFN